MQKLSSSLPETQLDVLAVYQQPCWGFFLSHCAHLLKIFFFNLS